jgi:MFS family permease
MLQFAGILLGMFAIGVMQLILATALPFIVSEIGGGNLYAWVFSSYMLASLTTIPIFSKLADIYGKRRFYILGISVFAIGSLYGGLSPGMTHLIASRVVQGLGAGIITPVALAMITDMFPVEKRGNMIGVFGLVQLLANLLSPPLGSFITKLLSWHWIFFLNLGMVILSGILVVLGGKRTGDRESKLSMKPSEIDIAGGLIFGAFCVLTVSFSNTMSKRGQWNMGGWLFFLAVIVAAAILVMIEKKHQNPVIKMEFLKTRIIRSSIISSILAGAIMYGLVTILPLCGIILKQQGFKLDESKILLFFMIGITVGLLTSSRFTGSRLASGGFASKLRLENYTKFRWIVMSASAILMAYSISIGNLVVFNLFNGLIGLCTGGIMATFMINSQNAISREDRTVLSGLIQLGRYFGASIGVTLLTGMLPEVGRITGIGQFTGAFGLLVVLCTFGLINEIV